MGKIMKSTPAVKAMRKTCDTTGAGLSHFVLMDSKSGNQVAQKPKEKVKVFNCFGQKPELIEVEVDGTDL